MKLLITGGSGFIGTNLVESLRFKGVSLVNVDINAPRINAHMGFWKKCDILNYYDLKSVFLQFQPTHVIHLAARTDTDSSDIEDYCVNTEGTASVLECVNNSITVERLIITSSQFVCGPGFISKNDEDFSPHTAYGRSKVINETQTRDAGLRCAWTIIRPSNIWGPWHRRYPKEFWLVLKRRLYFHPGRKPVIRSYGYVKNVVHQIEQIFRASVVDVNRKVFYTGDMPINLWDWANGFSVVITGKRARILPRAFIRSLGLLGDALAPVGIKFPITTSRFRSMTTNYLVPMEPTFQTLGPPPCSLRDGIVETVEWLRSEGFFDA